MKLETQMLIAKNIRTLRTSKCISQTDFAKMVGVSRSTYASYELGNRVPDAETLFLIAKKFGLNMIYSLNVITTNFSGIWRAVRYLTRNSWALSPITRISRLSQKAC